MPRPVEHRIREGFVSLAPWLFLIALALAGCDGHAPTGPPDPDPDADAGPRPCVPGELTRDDGTCQPAGLPPPPPCPPGELLLEDGITCQKAGVPPSACGVGFLPDGKEGCEPILPADTCPEGLMAVPGDTACHEVAPCGSGTWGNIPVEANTQFVDKSYAGGNSDGTQAKPWTTIQQGVNKAANGAIVAVAAGSYPEDVLIQGKAVRLWSRCPAMVEVVGTGVKSAAIRVYKDADGAEIHGVAATGAQLGIQVSGSSDVVIEEVLIHNTGDFGLAVQNDLGPTIVALKGSLLELNHRGGVFVAGSDVTVEATVVRSNLPDAQGSGGRGISIQRDSKVTVRACLVEQNHDIGVIVSDSDATIEATVVRSTLSDALGNGGLGIVIKDKEERANVTVRACLVEQNRDVGVYVVGSDATIEATVIRSTLPNGLGEYGYGIESSDNSATKARADVTVRACLVEQNHGVGVFVAGSDATIEATVVRSTLPDALGDGGRGINVQNDTDTKQRANVTVRACLAEQNRDVGVFVAGSDATIEATVVRSTLPDALGKHGNGITIQNHSATSARANVMVRASLVEQNYDVGLSVLNSDATIEATVVRSTLLDALGEGGRGIEIIGHSMTGERSNVTMRACLVEQNHDIGVHVSGSDVTIEATVVRSTLPDALGEGGRGINIEDDAQTTARANVTVRACLVEQSHEIGVFIMGSDATIEATVVSSTLPNGTGEGGRGINIQGDQVTMERSSATVRACRVEQNHDIGVFVSNSDATIVDSVVRDTAPQSSDNKFGDGISVFVGNAAIQNVEVTRNARAGVASFGGQVVITGGVLTCNGFDLEGEPFFDNPFTFDGSTGWQCSDKAPAECTELGDCHVKTTGIEAPSDPAPADPFPTEQPPQP